MDNVVECKHEWDDMRATAESTKNREVRRCPNLFCPEQHVERRLTPTGWWNWGRVAGAAVTLTAAVATLVRDDK
jgi:hypothetical protein